METGVARGESEGSRCCPHPEQKVSLLGNDRDAHRKRSSRKYVTLHKFSDPVSSSPIYLKEVFDAFLTSWVRLFPAALPVFPNVPDVQDKRRLQSSWCVPLLTRWRAVSRTEQSNPKTCPPAGRCFTQKLTGDKKEHFRTRVKSSWDYGNCTLNAELGRPTFAFAVRWHFGGLGSVCAGFPSSWFSLYGSASFLVLTCHHLDAEVCLSPSVCVVPNSSGCLRPDCFGFSVPLCLFSNILFSNAHLGPLTLRAQDKKSAEALAHENSLFCESEQRKHPLVLQQ